MKRKISIIVAIMIFFMILLTMPVDATEKYYTKTTKGKESNNVSDNNYSMTAYVVNSYLQPNSDGTITRIEYIDNAIVIEIYDHSFELKSQKTLQKELEYFGGFYSGENYNFLVFGQSNLNEDDSVEVMRVVKYSKQWERLESSSLRGNNTSNMFNAGSCRMTETRWDIIYRYGTYNVQK